MLGSYAIVLITASSREEAEKIARRALEERLAACANILDGVRSLFWWGGKIDEASELLLILKTKLGELEKLIELVEKIHSYEVPEVVAIPIAAGNAKYLEWVDKIIGKPEST